MIWFTADQHFGHENIIKYCRRPFASVEEMNVEISRRHNTVVRPGDHVFHLGDFSFWVNHESLCTRLQGLNGIHHLIKGNHDNFSTGQYLRAGFTEVCRRISGKQFLLEHHPAAVPPGLLVLQGHVHEKWKVRNQRINVGVDVWDFYPVSLQHIWNWVAPNGVLILAGVA